MADSYKVLIVGDLGAGKSCLCSQFVHGKSDIFQKIKSDLNYLQKKIVIDNSRLIKLVLWDIAAETKTNLVLPNLYYRNTTAAIIAYSTWSSHIESKVVYWSQNLKQKIPDVVLTIVCTHAEDETVENLQKMSKMANTYGASFFSVNSTTNSNINQLFEDIGGRITEKTKRDSFDFTEDGSRIHSLLKEQMDKCVPSGCRKKCF